MPELFKYYAYRSEESNYLIGGIKPIGHHSRSNIILDLVKEANKDFPFIDPFNCFVVCYGDGDWIHQLGIQFDIPISVGSVIKKYTQLESPPWLFGGDFPEEEHVWTGS